MMKLIRLTLLSLAFVLSGAVFGQSNLPACIESDVSRWSNCTGLVTTSNFIYSGAFLNGKFHGFGVVDVLHPSAKGQKYVGEFKDGEYNGQGTYTFLNGNKYVGQYKDGKRNGQGTYTFADGEKYVGEFKDGKFNGLGTNTFLNGNKYVGEFKDDKRNGQGTYTFADGDKYVGEFKDGKFNGQGTYTFLNGKKYVGEFKDDKYNGQGTYTFLNGNKYVGEFKDGKRNGQGTYTFADGNKYVGEFKDDKRNGQGVTITADAGIVLSEWIDDKEHGKFIRYNADKKIQMSGISAGGKIVSREDVDPNDFKRIATSIISDAFNELQERASQRLAEKRRRSEEADKFNEQEKIRKKLEYESKLVIENNKKFGTAEVGFFVNTFSNDGLLIGVFGEVRNNLKIDIKDILVQCKYIAQSGTDLTPTGIRMNEITIYEKWSPGEIRRLNFSIGRVQQTHKIDCKVLKWQ